MHELRHYRLYPGTLEAMKGRFNAINRPLFADHGIHLEQAWIQPDDPDSFYYLASFTDARAREAAWAAYHGDDRFIAAKSTQAEIIKEIEITLLEVFEEE